MKIKHMIITAKKCDESFVHKTSPPFAWRVAAIAV